MHPFLLLLLSLFLIPIFSNAITVTLRLGDNPANPALANLLGNGQSQTCNNLRPGRCCQGRPLPILPGLPGGVRSYRIAQFTGLEPLDIAAVWQPQGTVGGCSNVPVATTAGPGNWRYPAAGNSEGLLSGASYIKLPHSIPADQKAPMLEAQGILGLITGGGQYVAKQAGNSLLAQAAQAALALHGGKNRRRGIRSKDKGVVFAQPPPVAVWPDLIMVNGKNYTEESIGSSKYVSEDGSVLDLSGT